MTNTPKPFLMGAETEYAVSGHDREHALDPDTIYEALAAAVRAEHCSVPDRGGYRGMYLEHGGRLYLDYGSHPEHATAECFTPTQVAACDKAGEAILDRARRLVLERHPRWELAILKNNLDPIDPNDVTYGTHESYTCWVSPDVAAPQLLPHLASRVLYAGAGALTANSRSQGFELSQRSRHITSIAGQSTTGDRPLFGTRIRKESDYGAGGWTRMHLICKDAQRAPFGIYLTYATTGMLVYQINHGETVGRSLTLEDPLGAVRAFSRDPWLRTRARLADGRSLTALEIQFCYLAECERAQQRGALPEWAPEALRHWRQTLEDLGRDPQLLAPRLDAYCKLLIFEHELMRGNLDWNDLKLALARLTRLHSEYSAAVAHAVVSGECRYLSEEEREEHKTAMAAMGLTKDTELERLRFAVRLQALDLKYHELGGLYDRLHAAGRIDPVTVTDKDVERAMHQPPPGGRAEVRGDWIHAFAAEGDWFGNWDYLWHPPTARCVDLRDPFSHELHVRQLKLPEEVHALNADVLDLLYELAP
jgi:proteasome accessory factor A